MASRTNLPEEFLSPPDWFLGNDATASRRSGKPFFLYQSWIAQHTDRLIDSVRDARYDLVDLNMLDRPNDKQNRLRMLRFAERHPVRFHRMVMHKLAPFVDVASGLIVTLDWIPLMRHIVFAAAECGIPTILLPHESVFAKADMYYMHPTLGIRTPACDIILAWGNLQRDIFIERGYPAERIIKVGAPKFDYISKGSGSRSLVRLLGLDPAKPIVTFAAQPLDSQYDTQGARRAQMAAVNDLIDAVTLYGAQLIIRTPPSKDGIFDASLYKRVAELPSVVLDDANLYLLTPEQTIAITDVLVSINSTMLLEAALAGKVAISSKYVAFDQIWDGLNIPVAVDRQALHAQLKIAVATPAVFTAAYRTDWAADAFSIGVFDGMASSRVADIFDRMARRNQHGANGAEPDLQVLSELAPGYSPGYALGQPFAPPIEGLGTCPAREDEGGRSTYGIGGWRHLMTGPLAWVIARLGNKADVERFRKNPALFFRALSNPAYRRLGRLLYPRQ
jgi:hypothetical protein